MHSRGAQSLVLGLVVLSTCPIVLAGPLPKLLKGKSAPEPAPTPGAAQAKWSAVIAEVNGEPITREQLADDLIKEFGKQHLEMMIDEKVVDQRLRERKIEVTDAEVEGVIRDTLTRTGLSRKEFITQVLTPRDMTYSQYFREVAKRQLALKRLVADKVAVSEEELKKGFEATYGEKVQARILLVHERRKAEEFWNELNAIQDKAKKIERFEEICKVHSIDPATKPLGGRAQPINRHSSHKFIEDEAFKLEEGELSSILQVEQGNLVMICEGRIPARTDITLDSVANTQTKETVREMLTKRIEASKFIEAIDKHFQEIRTAAVVHNFLTGDFDPDAVKIASPPDSKTIR